MTRALVTGWFSFEGMGATAGDVLAAVVARRWLEDGGRSVRVAAVHPFAGDVSLDNVDPDDVDELVFVCGPFGNGWPVPDLIERFRHARFIGLDLSMLQPLADWNPFDVLFERESDRRAHPDLALASNEPLVPVIGLVEVHPQAEYGDRARHDDVGCAIRAALAQTRAAVVPIDTRLDINATGLRTAAEVESVIARCDVVVTTRLHGMVLALKNGVPAVVIDPITGGAKVRRQADRLGWSVCFTPETALPEKISAAITDCLGGAMAAQARACANRARAMLAAEKVEFLTELGATSRRPHRSSATSTVPRTYH
jgi:hypothetical protein